MIRSVGRRLAPLSRLEKVPSKPRQESTGISKAAESRRLLRGLTHTTGPSSALHPEALSHTHTHTHTHTYTQTNKHTQQET